MNSELKRGSMLSSQIKKVSSYLCMETNITRSKGSILIKSTKVMRPFAEMNPLNVLGEINVSEP